jgi:phosphohistidine phosphatase SixA
MVHEPSSSRTPGAAGGILRSLLVGLCLLSPIAAVALQPTLAPRQPAADVTVFLVRHAEAAAGTTRDPDLSETGRARARHLATVLHDVAVTHLFASEYRRTQQTLAPLAAQCGQEVRTIPARDADGLIQQLRRLPGGSVAVVAGHSNTIPDLVRRLGGTPTGLEHHPEHGWMLPHEEYGRLFVVTLQRHADAADAAFAGCLELRYGPACAGRE